MLNEILQNVLEKVLVVGFFSAGMMFKNFSLLACPLMVSPNEQGTNSVGSLGLPALPQRLHGKSFIMGQADFGVRYRI